MYTSELTEDEINNLCNNDQSVSEPVNELPEKKLSIPQQTVVGPSGSEQSSTPQQFSVACALPLTSAQVLMQGNFQWDYTNQSAGPPNAHDPPPNYDKVVNLIKSGLRVMVLIRGLPGSGKSYLSKMIVDDTMNGDYDNHIFSTDNYFMSNGRYVYDRNGLEQAHIRNQELVASRAKEGWSPIIIDNTNLRTWEMYPYVQYSIHNSYHIEIMEPSTVWSRNPCKLAYMNKHSVPISKIRLMMHKFDKTDVENILNILNLKKIEKPLLRNHPPLEKIDPSADSIKNVKVKKTENKTIKLEVLPKSPRKPKLGGTNRSVPSTSSAAARDFGTKYSEFKVNQSTHAERSKVKFDELWESSEECSGYSDNFTPLASKKIPKVVTFENVPRPQRAALNKKTGNTSDNVTQIDAGTDTSRENVEYTELCNLYTDKKADYIWFMFEKFNYDGNKTANFFLNNPDWIEPDYLVRPSTASGGTMDQFKFDFTDNNQDLPDFEPQKNNRNRNQKKATDSFAFNKCDNATNTGATSLNYVREMETFTPPEFNDEVVDVDLGIGLVTSLDSMFGMKKLDNNNNILNSFKTNVLMPKNIAKQLYALWLVSMYDQIEEQRYENIKQDEVYAKELNFNELNIEKDDTKPEMNLKDIAVMEIELSKYESVNPNEDVLFSSDILTKLKIEKLKEIFPNVDDAIIISILTENNNEFEETIRVLRERAENIDIEEAEILNDRGRSLIRKINAQKQLNAQGVKKKMKKSTIPISIKSSDEAINQALKNFEDYRSASMHHSQLRSECYAKAKFTAERNRKDIAFYYTQIASLHNTKIDAYNHQAANSIVEAHNLRHNNPDLLDLHYLHTTEALQSLDIFLDQHIDKLRANTSKYVFVITGRGLHSANGIPIIKVNVKNRLKERGLG